MKFNTLIADALEDPITHKLPMSRIHNQLLALIAAAINNPSPLPNKQTTPKKHYKSNKRCLPIYSCY